MSDDIKEDVNEFEARYSNMPGLRIDDDPLSEAEVQEIFDNYKKQFPDSENPSGTILDHGDEQPTGYQTGLKIDDPLDLDEAGHILDEHQKQMDVVTPDKDVNEYEARYSNMPGLIIDDPSGTILDHEGMPDPEIEGDQSGTILDHTGVDHNNVPYSKFDGSGFLLDHEGRIPEGAKGFEDRENQSSGVKIDFESGSVTINGKPAELSDELNKAAADDGFDEWAANADKEFDNAVADMDKEFEQDVQEMGSSGFKL